MNNYDELLKNNIKKIPFNCDLFLLNDDLLENIKNYKFNLIDDNKIKLFKSSDHKMIYFNFEYNDEKYIIFSWNMSAFDYDYDINNNYNYDKIDFFIKLFYKNYIENNNYDYIIFGFQEFHNKSIFYDLLNLFFLKKKYKINKI
jgi:hypothetical protein